MKHTLELYKQKRFKIISERMMEVDSNIIQEVIKKGRTVMTCSCENSATFAHNNICRHKKFFIMFPLLEKLNANIEKIIEYYQSEKSVNQDINYKKLCGFIINDLEQLRRLE